MPEKEQKQNPHTLESMERLIMADGRYPVDAYAFLHDGLAVAVKRVHGEKPGEPGQRHVSGADLCKALRDLAIERWGMLARTVLRRWNINATFDFGQMVYLLVNKGFMQKTEEDSVEDFRNVFEFEGAFRVRMRFELKE